jgi:hypothetical protein
MRIILISVLSIAAWAQDAMSLYESWAARDQALAAQAIAEANAYRKTFPTIPVPQIADPRKAEADRIAVIQAYGRALAQYDQLAEGQPSPGRRQAMFEMLRQLDKMKGELARVGVRVFKNK